MELTIKDILKKSVIRIKNISGDTAYAKPVQFTEKHIHLEYISKEEADALIAEGWPIYDKKPNVPFK